MVAHALSTHPALKDIQRLLPPACLLHARTGVRSFAWHRPSRRDPTVWRSNSARSPTRPALSDVQCRNVGLSQSQRPVAVGLI